MNYSEPGFSATPGVGTLRFGADINQNFAVEGMLGNTLSNASGTYSGTAVTIQLKNVFGMYLKAKTQLSDNFEVFARLGATRGTISASSYYASAWSSGTSISYGIGAQVNLNKSVYASVDYMSYYDKTDIAIRGPSIGIGVKF